jgi:hypothetical protein
VIIVLVCRLGNAEVYFPSTCYSEIKGPRRSKWVHEIKHDGYRLQIHLNKGANSHDWTNCFPLIARESAWRRLSREKARHWKGQRAAPDKVDAPGAVIERWLRRERARILEEPVQGRL